MKEAFYKMRFSLAERRMFYEIMASYLDSNVTFSDALDSMYNRAKKDKNYKAYIYKDIITSLGSGKSPSQALHKWIPPNERMLIEAGEKGGKISESFQETIFLADSIAKIKKVVVSNMVMPFIMILILFGIMVGFRIGMVPIFLDLSPLEKWTPNASLVYEITDFVYEYWYVFIGLLVGGSIIVMSTINVFTGPFRKICDKFPPYNIYKKFVESSFLITFASLLKAKFPIMSSLKSMHKNATPYLRVYLNKMMDNIGRGMKNEGEALNVGLLNKELAGILEDTAKLANFETAVYNLGTRNIEKSIIEVTAIMKVVNSMMVMLVLGFTLYMFFSIQELAFGVSETLTS